VLLFTGMLETEKDASEIDLLQLPGKRYYRMLIQCVQYWKLWNQIVNNDRRRKDVGTHDLVLASSH